MEYNIHPIVVHFPIALLVLAGLIYVLPIKKFFPRLAWNDIARFLLVIGFIGGVAAHITGETAEELIRPQEDLVEAHATFAAVTLWSFGILLASELLVLLPGRFREVVVYKKIVLILGNRFVQGVLALAGLVAVFLTGLLGGVLVHGTSADPLAPLVLKMLGIDY